VSIEFDRQILVAAIMLEDVGSRGTEVSSMLIFKLSWKQTMTCLYQAILEKTQRFPVFLAFVAMAWDVSPSTYIGSIANYTKPTKHPNAATAHAPLGE
jgi:hypothetical protein